MGIFGKRSLARAQEKVGKELRRRATIPTDLSHYDALLDRYVQEYCDCDRPVLEHPSPSSANVLMAPNDQYLCIVRGAGNWKSGDKLYLPFEGDGTLALILSKAFLLAADDKITDTTILSQIKR